LFSSLFAGGQDAESVFEESKVFASEGPTCTTSFTMKKYTSTRGTDTGRSFATVVLKGLADDGGLFVPESLPHIGAQDLWAWRNLSYPQLAHKIFSLFIEESEVPSEDLKELIERSYATFFVKDVVPIVPLVLHEEGKDDSAFFVAELFHGPTFSFKDFALQFLGNLFEYFLCRNERQASNGKVRHTTDFLSIKE